MQKLDLKRIIKTANLKTAYVGAHLFPNNVDPSKAVTRVCRGDAFLNSEQIAKLAELLNVPIGLLFDNASWHMSVEADRKNVIRFRSYDYYAELNTEAMTSRVSFNGTLYFEEVRHEKGIGLTEYLSLLTDLIIRYK